MASTPAEPAAAPPLAEADVPDWLADMAPATAPPPAEADVPDWLADMVPVEAEPAAAPPLAEADAPDWLADMAPVEAEPAAAPPLAQADIPDWLAARAPSATAKELPAPPITEDAALPPSAETDLGEPISPGELPEWLLQMRPAEAAVPSPTESGLAQAEIPDWVQAMRPGAPPTLAPEEEVESGGLLAGIAGVVQAASAVTTPSLVPATPAPSNTEAALARARLWQDLIARSAQPSSRPLPQARDKKARDRFERWLIYGIVALAVIAPIFAGVDLFDALSLDQPPTAEAGVAFDLVNGIVAQDTPVAPVLIAFDYAPSYMGELHLQAESLLHHLAMRQARIMAISLTPEGAGLAQQLLDDVLSEHDGYQAGQNYVNLGYLPGEAVGIRSLEFLPQRFQGESFDGAVEREFGKLKDAPIFGDDAAFVLSKVSLIVVLTGDVNDLRWWIEQTTVLEEDLPLVAGVSAAIEPQVRPYYDMASPQIDGLIIGLAGAVGYENEMDYWLVGPANLRFGGQLVGLVAVSALILIGMLVFGISRKRGKETTA